ncbi:phosphotransferase [Planomonospora parontospora]|uniref:phosphotransferase n=1 Tax=Planomonospora parontospora TaxID=58119 RepID=UPI00166FD0CE|nr:phosphotransferase [Planomonospora parontospora]GGL25269.1 hypothetical protein GCM10014719_28660 [Planomonospora parontospora subsp. antibiotica]GII16357.1 hypothetical protein Ppa05_30830 [Planomonospora parontospora subsp. antibiotica]
MTAHAQASARAALPADEITRVAAAFDVGTPSGAVFLPAGMMNRNWRIETPEGVFALKEIADVPVAKARRSLTVLQALAAAGLPVCPPRSTVSGDLVAAVDGRCCTGGRPTATRCGPRSPPARRRRRRTTSAA